MFTVIVYVWVRNSALYTNQSDCRHIITPLQVTSPRLGKTRTGVIRQPLAISGACRLLRRRCGRRCGRRRYCVVVMTISVGHVTFSQPVVNVIRFSEQWRRGELFETWLRHVTTGCYV